MAKITCIEFTTIHSYRFDKFLFYIDLNGHSPIRRQIVPFKPLQSRKPRVTFAFLRFPTDLDSLIQIRGNGPYDKYDDVAPCFLMKAPEGCRLL